MKTLTLFSINLTFQKSEIPIDSKNDNGLTILATEPQKTLRAKSSFTLLYSLLNVKQFFIIIILYISRCQKVNDNRKKKIE